MAKHKAAKQADRAKVWRYVSWGLICLLVMSLQSFGRAASPSPSPTPTASKTATPKAPSITQKKIKKAGLHKNEVRQYITVNKWTDFQGGGFTLNGKRTLFFAQLHLTCSKAPKYVKIRLARHHKNGSLDTTGTNTWIMGKKFPRTWQGSLWWESRTWHPITAQFYVSGGKCFSPQRQFKYWQP